MLRCMSADGGGDPGDRRERPHLHADEGPDDARRRPTTRPRASSRSPRASGSRCPRRAAPSTASSSGRSSPAPRTRSDRRSACSPHRGRAGARRPDHGRAPGGTGPASPPRSRRRAAQAPRAGARAADRARRDRRRLPAVQKAGSTDDPLPTPDHRRQLQVVDARRDVLRAVHADARQHGRERRAAIDPEGPRRQPLEPRVGGQRLHAQLRRPARHRRAPRRHLRPPPDVPRRGHDLRAVLGHRRAGAGHDDADRQPRRCRASAGR